MQNKTVVLHEYAPPLRIGKLIKRYKRFLADIEWPDGEISTVHCPNTGSMLACAGHNWPVAVSYHANPGRKYPWTLEMTHNGLGWIGIHTGRTNALVQRAIESGSIKALQDHGAIRAEVRCGDNCRMDLMFHDSKQTPCWVEIKNVTLAQDGVFYFPDAVTTRGSKHIETLMRRCELGERGVLFFLIQHPAGEYFTVAEHIDAVFANNLRRAASVGVEIMAWQTIVSPSAICLNRAIPVRL